MLTPWFDAQRPFTDFDALRRRLDDAFFARPAGALLSSAAFDAAPRASFRDTDDALLLTFELPGFTQEDLKVDVTRELLTVYGKRSVTAPEGYVPTRTERGSLEFRRSFALPVPIDADTATAVVRDGILTITLPKLPEVRPRSIAIHS